MSALGAYFGDVALSTTVPSAASTAWRAPPAAISDLTRGRVILPTGHPDSAFRAAVVALSDHVFVPALQALVFSRIGHRGLYTDF